MVYMRVIKRRKGRKFYFYLQYSFRENGKVITRERYLGLGLSKNIDKIKEEIEKEQRSRIYSKLEKIRENFQKEWRKIPESAKERDLEEIAIAFTYNTNAIEGSTITLAETREIIKDKVAPKKSLSDIKETESHYRIFLKMLSKKEKVTKELLLRWHKEIFGETKPDIAGIFRNYFIRVGPYAAPDWQDIEQLMDKLITFTAKSKFNPTEFAARAHFRFEKIHPFGDGNGRIGRLLMNHILWHSGYPMLIIEYKKRKSYYKALEKDEEYFVRYFIRKYLSVHKKRLGP